ncbi:hypothetical protein N9242_00990 [Vicingaceae bacterium]|nr:hypothetical protein [Vicingaceae bacterium]
MQLNYSVKVGPKFDMFGLIESNPINPVLLVDNVSSVFELSRIKHQESNMFIKSIKSVTSSSRKTKILSNTTDVKMTDIIDINGVPLFNKILIKNIHKSTIYVDGIEITEKDTFFIYCNSDKEISLVEYFSTEGVKIYSEYKEVFPMFIWQEQLNLADIIKKDNKKYSFKLSGRNIFISASKTGVVAVAKNESVFTLKRLRENLVKIEPFFVETLRSDSGGRYNFKYNYQKIIPDLSTRRLEQVIIRSDNIIELENVDILKSSLVIYKKKPADYIITPENMNDEYRDYEVILDNSSNVYDNIIQTINGKIDITILLKEKILKYEDNIFINYKYVKVNNISKIEEEDIDLTNNTIHFRIKPTTINKKGIKLEFIPELSYIITDIEGNILLSRGDEIPESTYELPLMLGYGEGPYGEFGFSGERDDFSLLTITERTTSESSEEYGTGYGENGYSSGPFGGSFLKNISVVQDLLDIKNNSESGMITIASIEYISKIARADVYPYKNVSLANGELKRKTLYNYNNIVWHMSNDNNPSDIIKRASIDRIKTYSTIDFKPYIQFKDADEAIVEFDISRIHDVFSNIGEVEASYLLTSGVSQIANDVMDIYSGIMPTVSSLLTDVAVFNLNDDKEYEEVILDIEISSDLRVATVTIDLTVVSPISNIGLGFKNSDITIYPTSVINI